MKQENVYINQYSSMTEAKIGLTRFFNDYNNYRPHQALNGKTPAEVYFGQNKKTAFFQQFANLNINLNTVSAKSTF